MADDLAIERREGLAIASVMARRNVAPAAIGAALGVELPPGPRATFAGTRTIVGTGPGSWLVVTPDPGPDLATTLASLASVSEQSGAYVVYRVSGALARTLLQRGAAIDFHPDSFGVGSAATTVIAHIGAIVWQIDERPSYDVAVFRSYDASFRHWLDATVTALGPG